MSLQGENIPDLFCRYLVGLSVLVREVAGTQREQSEVFSCFVMEVSERWFLITAGHCVEHLKALHDCAKYQVLRCALYDGWAPARSGTLIPFNFRDARAYSIDRDDLGIDIGVIELDPLLRRMLEAGGVVSLGPSSWAKVPDDLIGHVVVGQPCELLRPTYSGNCIVDFKVDPVVLPVEECDPPEDMRKPVSRFYAQVPEELRLTDHSVLHDIAGMSGGPIFGLQKCPDGQLACYLVAVQGSWKNRVIAATRTSWVGHALAVALASGHPNALAKMFSVAGSSAADFEAA